MFFDDFAYTGTNDAAFKRAWSVRTERGGPGQDGASWSPSAVAFSGTGSAALMSMTASTDGTGAGTVQSEVDSQRTTFLDGTYAFRMRFTDAPTGPTGASIYETAFTISNGGDGDANYSEMDFEYLPIGGSGDDRTQLDLTSWHSTTDSQASIKARSFDGWHTLVMTVANGVATYYVDGANQFSTSGKYYPRATMMVAFNIWFIDGELGGQGAKRTYTQQVDWTYFTAGRVLTPTEVQQQVDAQRSVGKTFVDSLG